MDKIKLLISLVFILGPTFYFGFVGKSVEMGVALGAGALAAAFINLDKLQKFKGGGLELELKEAVKEANATLENLKSVADPLFISTIKIMSEGLRWDGISEVDQHDIVRLIENAVKDTIPSQQVTDTIDRFYKLNLRDAFDRVLIDLKDYYRDDVSKQLYGLIDVESSVFPSEKQIREVLSQLEEIHPKTNDLIEKYVFYKNNKYPKLDS